MKPLLECTNTELENLMIKLKEKPYRAAQIKQWLNNSVNFENMTNLPLRLREELMHNFKEGYLNIASCKIADDGTKKYLFALQDGNIIESVFLPKEYGKTICISTQVGCAMGCTFCASGQWGFIRNLSTSEILAQVVQIASLNGGIDRIVVMGMGEPLNNYNALIDFLYLINAKNSLNIGMRHISVSTCGITDKIYALAKEKLGINLSISLHAPTQKNAKLLCPQLRNII